MWGALPVRPRKMGWVLPVGRIPGDVVDAFLSRELAFLDEPTNAFSKKVENFSHAVALHYMHYNFARPHQTLANPYPRTPAMAAGVADHIWTLQEIAGLLD